MKKLIVLIIGLGCSLLTLAQDRVTLSGYVKDSLSSETLIGANIAIKGTDKGISTNQYGFYSISLKPATYTVVVSFVGYTSATISIDLTKNKQLNILLAPKVLVENNVVVTSRKRENNIKAAQMGKIDLSVATAKALPSFLGEVDILKTLQLLPGVRNAGKGNAGF